MRKKQEQQYVISVPFFHAPNSIFDLDLSADEKLVYLYLCRCGNNGSSVFPSYNKIAEKCGISRATAIRTIDRLVERNLLDKTTDRVSEVKNKSNTYTLYIGDTLLPQIDEDGVYKTKTITVKGEKVKCTLLDGLMVSERDYLVSQRYQGSITQTPGVVSERYQGGIRVILYKLTMDKELLYEEPCMKSNDKPFENKSLCELSDDEFWRDRSQDN